MSIQMTQLDHIRGLKRIEEALTAGSAGWRGGLFTDRLTSMHEMGILMHIFLEVKP